jgi:hypothetical protein
VRNIVDSLNPLQLGQMLFDAESKMQIATKLHSDALLENARLQELNTLLAVRLQEFESSKGQNDFVHFSSM